MTGWCVLPPALDPTDSPVLVVEGHVIDAGLVEVIVFDVLCAFRTWEYLAVLVDYLPLSLCERSARSSSVRRPVRSMFGSS